MEFLNLPLLTWLVYPFMVLELAVILIWAYFVKKKNYENGDKSKEGDK